MKKNANVLTLVIVVLASGCVTNTSVLYRISGDETSEILYVSPFLALAKSNGNYDISFAHWLNDPELSELTGDVVDKPLVYSVKLIGQLKSQGLLFGQGDSPNSANWFASFSINPTNDFLPAHFYFHETRKPSDSETGYFIITFDRVLFFRTEMLC